MNCMGCGADLAQQARGRPRKWCSDNCRKRHWERDHDRPTCQRCGTLMGVGVRRKGSVLCRRCFDADRHVPRVTRGRLIEQWWAEGLSMREIASRLGWSRGSLGREMDWLRADGFDLPYRHHGQAKGRKYARAA